MPQNTYDYSYAEDRIGYKKWFIVFEESGISVNFIICIAKYIPKNYESYQDIRIDAHFCRYFD